MTRSIVRANPMASRHCHGCGLELTPIDGPTDAYGGASPACWALFGELLRRDYEELKYPAVHGLAVDAYMAQHPGYATAAGRRSVITHLLGLQAWFERGLRGRALIAVRVGAFPDKSDPAPFLPVPSHGALTVAQVVNGPIEEHATRIEAWARSVWSSWSAHHEAIRSR
jgi:hypothetical protein